MLILRLTARLKTPKLLPQNPSAVYRRRTLMTLPPFSLEGKTCVVTDAARSLGREFLTAFASSGAKGYIVPFSITAPPIQGVNYAHLLKHLSSRACVDLFHSAAESLIKTICEHAYKTSGIGLKLPEEDLEISSPQPDLQGYACDVTSEQDVKKTFASILDDISKIDVVVIAADIVENFEAENHEYHKWKKMLDVNFKGSWLWAREAGK